MSKDGKKVSQARLNQEETEESTPTTVRRSLRKGKKKSDPDFVGTDGHLKEIQDQKPDAVGSAEELVEESQPDEDENIEEDSDDANWEAFVNEYPELDAVPHQGRYECRDCSKSFHHKNDLVRHMNIHNGTKPYTCDVCGKSFLRSDYLRLHVIKHQGVKPLQCDVCERRFYDRSNLRQHMRTHTGEKPAMCPYCPHRCSQLSDMRKHLTIHTKEKAFQCDTCGKTFSLKTGLVAHQRLHTGERPFACEYCPKRFRDHTSMRRHRRIHTGDKPFLCTHCGKTFTQVANMKRHMLTHTSDNCKDKGRLYPCPFCGIELASKSDVRSHVAKDHEQKTSAGSKSNPEEATTTKKKNQSVISATAPDVLTDFPDADESENQATKEDNSFATGERGEQGTEVENIGTQVHICVLCGKIFPSDVGLQEHLRTHEASVTSVKDKDYQCETCGKTFCQASSLKAHQLVHSGLKPHGCSLCPSRFRKTHHLRRHMLVHTGERPYGCDFCDRTFTSSGNLNKHRAIHLGQKNFECEFCAKKFTQSSNLTKHRAIHLRQQQKPTSSSTGSLDQITVYSAVKKRGRKAAAKASAIASSVAVVQILPSELDETMEIPLELHHHHEGDSDERGEGENHAAVLHIVGGEDGDQDPDGMMDGNGEGGQVSYEIIAEGDVIIEI